MQATVNDAQQEGREENNGVGAVIEKGLPTTLRASWLRVLNSSNQGRENIERDYPSVDDSSKEHVTSSRCRSATVSCSEQVIYAVKGMQYRYRWLYKYISR